MSRKALIWNAGAPPRRGVYRVKSDGPSANTGYRYWYGDAWSNHRNRRYWAQELGKKREENRNTPLKYPVLWASAAPHPNTKENIK